MRIQFIEDIKHKIGKYVFQRDLKYNKRHKSVCNLEDAKSIGILFEATTKEQITQVKPLVDYFFKLKKDVKAFGFVNSKNYDECHVPRLQYDFFNKKDFGGSGFFSEIFSKFGFGKHDVEYYYYNPDNDSPGIDYWEVVEEDYFDIALGAAIGNKWVNKKGWTFLTKKILRVERLARLKRVVCL